MLLVMQKIFMSLGLFVFVCTAYFIAAPQFGGIRDDFGDLAARHDTPLTWQSIIRDGRVNAYLASRDGSHDFVQHKKTTTQADTFFKAFYRPVALWLQVIVFNFFGDNFTAIYRINVIIHALNTVLLFLLGMLMASVSSALLFSLFFAFHPVHGMYFGHVSNMQYYVFVLLFLLLTTLFWHFMETGKRWCFVGGLFLYLASLGLRETALMAPAALGGFFATLFCQQRNYLRRLTHLVAGLATIDILFLCWRLYLYPFVFDSTSESNLVLSNLAHKYLGLFHLLVYDVLGASDIAYGAHGLKYMYLLVVGGLMIFAWWHATNRLQIAGSCIAASFLLLPPFVIGYHSRHLYDALPYVIMCFVLLAKGICLYASPVVKRLMAVVVVLLITSKALICLNNLSMRAQYTVLIQEKIKAFVGMPALPDASSLCLLAYPAVGYFTFMDRAVSIYLNDACKPVLMDRHCAITNPIEVLVNDARLLRCCTKTFAQGLLYAITRSGPIVTYTFFKPIRAELTDAEQLANGAPSPLSDVALGCWQLIRDDDLCKQYQLTLRDELMDMHPVFIAWNPEVGAFEIC
jgi:hypothetical protein